MAYAHESEELPEHVCIPQTKETRIVDGHVFIVVHCGTCKKEF